MKQLIDCILTLYTDLSWLLYTFLCMHLKCPILDINYKHDFFSKHRFLMALKEFLGGRKDVFPNGGYRLWILPKLQLIVAVNFSGLYDRSRNSFVIVLVSKFLKSWYILMIRIRIMLFTCIYSLFEMKGSLEIIFVKNFSFLCLEFWGVF